MSEPLDLVAAVRRACADLAAGVPAPELARAAAIVSERYRAASAEPGTVDTRIRSRQEAVASLVTRFPATFAACSRVARLVGESMPGFRPESAVDVGAGSGASALAVAGAWPSIGDLRLVEPSAHMATVGADLLGRIGRDEAAGWRWDHADGQIAHVEPADLVVLSYVVGEQLPDRLEPLVTRWWAACRGVLLVVEPGTPAGFERIARIRTLVTGSGGSVVAPCPHDGPCPLAGEQSSTAATAADWCHFGVRLARSSEHRRLKGGDLSYEDEKFSFVAASRLPAERPAGRVLRRPTRARRRVDLTVCRVGGDVARAVVPQSLPSYRAATKTEWGDAWPALPMSGGRE